MQDRIKSWLSLLLVLSVFISLIFVLLGGILYLSQQGQETVAFQLFSPSNSILTFTALFQALREGQALALVQLGILILVLAQILRVLTLGLYFLRSSEYWLSVFSFFIFLVLTYSMMWHQ